MFRVLKRNDSVSDPPLSLAVNSEYPSRDGALEAAKLLCGQHQWCLVVVQDTDEVQMAAVVVNSFVPPQPPPSPKMVSRDIPALSMFNDELDGTPRQPQKKPKLLVLNRVVTAEELATYQMIVEKGQIIKNAFGALEVEDMPLNTEELLQVKRALGPQAT